MTRYKCIHNVFDKYNVLQQDNTKYRCLKCLSTAIETYKDENKLQRDEQYLSHFLETDDTILVHINCRKLIPQIGELLLIKCAS